MKRVGSRPEPILPICYRNAAILVVYETNWIEVESSVHTRSWRYLREVYLTGLFIQYARRGLAIIVVSTTVPERAILAVSSLGVALRTGQSGASKAQNYAFS